MSAAAFVPSPPTTTEVEPHFHGKVILTDSAADFFSLPKETSLSEITWAIVDYCKKNKLIDGQAIHPNAALMELLDMDPRDSLTVLNLQRYLRGLYTIPGNHAVRFQEKAVLPDKLATFLVVPSGSMLSRSEVTRAFVDYCKTNRLLDGTTINADAALTELFGLQPGEEVHILNLQRYIRPLYKA